VPLGLPALSRAQKIQKRAVRVGFDWPSIDGVFDKVHEELDELHAARADENIDAVREEYGDLLFTMVSLARHLGIDSEQALRLATQKFESRIGEVLRLAKRQGIDLTIATDNEKNGLWDQAKNA
ncbi:MAG: MazG nucleotide pyrophosphohydrolase domain-containing protein, partial [Gammaproteobacteria bacterium]